MRGFIYRLGQSLKDCGERMAHKKVFGILVLRWCCDPVIRVGLAIRDIAVNCPIGEMRWWSSSLLPVLSFLACSSSWRKSFCGCPGRMKISKTRAFRIQGTVYVWCITCGSPHYWSEGHQINCGHFLPRGRKATRYDERNCHGQCVHCNKYKSGEWDVYEQRMIELYGKEAVDELKQKSRIGGSYDAYGLQLLLEEYKEKVIKRRSIKLQLTPWIITRRLSVITSSTWILFWGAIL